MAPVTVDDIARMLDRVAPAAMASRRRRQRTVAHLLLPADTPAGHVTIARDTVTWRGISVERTGDDPGDLHRLVQTAWQRQDQALDPDGEASLWVKPLRRGRRWHLHGTRELFNGPLTTVEIIDATNPHRPDVGQRPGSGDENHSREPLANLLETATGRIVAAMRDGQQPPLVDRDLWIDGDARLWRAHLVVPRPRVPYESTSAP